MERVEETPVLVKSSQLGHLLLSKLEVEEANVLCQSLNLGSLDKRDQASLDVPSESDLSGRDPLGLSKLSDDRILDHHHVLELLTSSLE